MKPEASWWFDKMKGAVLKENSEEVAEKVKNEATKLAKGKKKFPDTLPDNPPKDWLREWEEKHS